MSVPPSSPETGPPVVALLQLMAEWQSGVWQVSASYTTLYSIRCRQSLERQHCCSSPTPVLLSWAESDVKISVTIPELFSDQNMLQCLSACRVDKNKQIFTDQPLGSRVFTVTIFIFDIWSSLWYLKAIKSKFRRIPLDKKQWENTIKTGNKKRNNISFHLINLSLRKRAIFG